MAVNSFEECRSVLVFPDGGDTNKQYEAPSSITYLEVSKLMKSQPSLISVPIVQSLHKVEGDKVNSYAPCILRVDIEKGRTENPKLNEESLASLKSDDFLTRASLRGICLKIGGKFTQLLMNHDTELPKFTSRDKLVAERVQDTTNSNRSRKYKRSASFNSRFNSRRVVVLFSALSIIGTIILIYLTLRMRQISDASGNI